jgi:hypothetical protein
MSVAFVFGGSVLCGLFCAKRLGLFGKTITKINKDDEYETVVRGIFYDTAYWNPGDCYLTVFKNSFRPIEFEYTEEYSGWGATRNIDQNGNKN